MTRAAQIYDFSLAAGGNVNLAVSGGYYRIMSATGAVRVRREGGSQLGPLYPGQGEREEFNRLTITDVSGAANTGYILVSEESFVDERITGEVAVIDGGRAATLAGSSYITLGSLGVVGGNYNCHQLLNPAGSGRRVVIEGVFAGGTVSSLVFIGHNNVALPNLYGASPSSNKLSGGAAGLAERRWENSAVVNGNTSATLAAFLPANQNFLYTFKRPIVLLPGAGYAISDRTVAADLQSGFDFYEEVIT